MDQIRQLEWEELQVEEAHSDDDDDDDDATHGGPSASEDVTFDTSLAALHTYLGEVDDTHHRIAFLEGGAVLNLPLFYLEGVVLFPGATLPLRVVQPNFIAAVEKAMNQLDASYTIGVVRVYRDNGRIRFSTIGTTAEIRQYKQLDDGSVNVVTRGQQRFCLKRRWIDVEGSPCGEVHIIQEDFPLRTPRDVVGHLAPLRNLRAPLVDTSASKVLGCAYKDSDSDAMSEERSDTELSMPERSKTWSTIAYYSCDSDDTPSSSDGDSFECQSEVRLDESPLKGSTPLLHQDVDKMRENDCLEMQKKLFHEKSGEGSGCKKKLLSRFREAPRAFWPYWTYRMYDSYCLAQKAADKWKQIVGSPIMDVYVKQPDRLSFHIGSKIPVSESTRQELLEIDGISYRLRREIELLENFDLVRCKHCQTVIGKRSDMLVMSSDGPLGAYVNPGGYVHEVITLHETNGLALSGSPVKEYSWFPGYAWTITNCSTCERQMGWLFTATNKQLRPRSFWGIRCSQVADNTR